MNRVRKGQNDGRLSRTEFGRRFQQQWFDPAYDTERDALARIEDIAWQAMKQGHKSPVTRPAGRGFADPAYETSVEWLDTRQRLKAAQAVWKKPGSPSRVLVICASSRNDGTCPGEVSKTWRLARILQRQMQAQRMVCDFLDLSLMNSEYGRRIHPCKGCVSTAMPLCHWPCSCYPNHGQGQTQDWMAEIYERWVSAHGVAIVAPTYWYQSPSPLKLMIDRLVCADGGNPDVTSTHGKTASEAKRIEAQGWDYPKHLAGRVYGLVVHGDVAGVESQRRNLADWLDWMGLVAAGGQGVLDRYIGYFEPYASSHEALDRDRAVQDEVRHVARSVVRAVKLLRAGKIRQPDADLGTVRPK